jgi:hypothetical protein
MPYPNESNRFSDHWQIEELSYSWDRCIPDQFAAAVSIRTILGQFKLVTSKANEATAANLVCRQFVREELLSAWMSRDQ